ncbi:MAG: lysophospholipid acyltransferase family protein [Mariprofundus sp.]|nr:lysophospholipid acyltransferase family protein [Mariprofundus sp.]
MKERLIRWLVPRFIKYIYLFLNWSIRWHVVGVPYRSTDSTRYIYACWHARLLMMSRISSDNWHGYMLISEHRDGGFIADAIQLLSKANIVIRGSTTRGGARAMLKMLRAVKAEKRHLAITPDGPKGPREVVQKGTVQLAMKSGLPIQPLCYASEHHWRAKSWDRFYIPRPFSRGVFVMGDLLTLSAEDTLETSIERVQLAMDTTQQQADNFFQHS